MTPKDAVAAVLPRLHGAFALAILFRDHPDMLDRRPPGRAADVVGYGDGETYLGSDALGAGARSPSEIAYLDEGDWAVVTHDGVQIFDRDERAGRAADRRIPAPAPRRIEKGNHRHFMQKEIFEQPIVVAQTLQSYLRPLEQKVALPDMDFSFADVPRSPSSPAAPASMPAWSPNIGSSASPACRSSSMSPPSSATASRSWRRAAWRCSSPSRARPPTRSPRSATPATQGQKIAVVVNVPTSSMAREADLLLPTHAGPEIGVASTKAFTCQLAVLAALAAKVARDKGRMSEEEEREIVGHLTEAPAAMNAALAA